MDLGHSGKTKQKILSSARVVFAEKGYVGASIREIAKGADVNVALINYHFENKQNLYAQIFTETHLWLEELVQLSVQTESDFKSSLLCVFKRLLENGQRINNAFRMFLSEDIPSEISQESLKNDPNQGPPGQSLLEQKLHSQLGKDVNPVLLTSVVNSLYALVIHWSIVSSTECYKNHYAGVPGLTLEDKIHALGFQCDAIINKLIEEN